MYEGKVQGMKLTYTFEKDYLSGRYASTHQAVVIVLDRDTNQDNLDSATEMLKFYASAPLTLCLMSDSVSSRL